MSLPRMSVTSQPSCVSKKRDGRVRPGQPLHLFPGLCSPLKEDYLWPHWSRSSLHPFCTDMVADDSHSWQEIGVLDVRIEDSVLNFRVEESRRKGFLDCRWVFGDLGGRGQSANRVVCSSY